MTRSRVAKSLNFLLGFNNSSIAALTSFIALSLTERVLLYRIGISRKPQLIFCKMGRCWCMRANTTLYHRHWQVWWLSLHVWTRVALNPNVLCLPGNNPSWFNNLRIACVEICRNACGIRGWCVISSTGSYGFRIERCCSARALMSFNETFSSAAINSGVCVILDKTLNFVLPTLYTQPSIGSGVRLCWQADLTKCLIPYM